MPKEATVTVFEQEASSVMGGLRRALADLIEAGGTGGIHRAADVQKKFGIDASLGWQIFRIATSPEPVQTGAFVPGAAPMRRVLAAARRRGVPEQTVAAAAAAYERFEELVQHHAGDRSSFDAMIGALGGADGEATERLAQRHKRAAYRANSYAWGVQARLWLNLVVYSPSKDPSKLDDCYVRGLLDVRQLRTNVSCLMRTTSHIRTARRGEDFAVQEAVSHEPIDPEAHAKHGVALLEPFCSKPLPRIDTSSPSAGVVKTDLFGSGVGRDSCMDIVIGEVMRYVGPVPGPGNHWASSAWARTPAELLISDVLVPRGLSIRSSVRAEVHGSRFLDDEAWSGDEHLRLPFHETAQFIGTGVEALRTPAVPRYAELAQHVFDRLGWDGDSFDVYRCRVEYPFLHSVVTVKVDAAE